ncbi:MAG: RagB/SusD family nutrient uptake outer membrane protein [Gemmatimonadetes bacterium]|nr:RagB/SusD family nutrient uptake outer membrane protein [Gemmatimonadota bacterium]
MRTHIKHRRHRVAAVLQRLVLLGALGGVAACEGLLDVNLPGRVPASTLDNPQLASTLVMSAISDFECAYNNYSFGASVHSDEMWHSSGNQIMRSWGQRRITPDMQNYVSETCQGWGYGLFTTIHTARFQADDAIRRLEGFPDAEVADKPSLLATAAAYAGYSYTLLGEGFCETPVDGGPLLTPAEVLRIAEERFTKAIQLAEGAGNQDILNMARVGRARVRLNLGDRTGAAADARLVPEGYNKVATRSGESERRWNKARRWFEDGGHATVAPGFRNLTWKGVPDPRVQVRNTGRKGFDAVTDLWVSNKYPTLESPIPLATGKEAQLIIAEAEGGQTAVDIINRLHERAGIPPYDPATDGDIMAQVLEERRRELFQEGGHRLNDMLRHNLPFFEGVDHVGQTYGNTTCFPLPLIERTGNPNIPG